MLLICFGYVEFYAIVYFSLKTKKTTTGWKNAFWESDCRQLNAGNWLYLLGIILLYYIWDLGIQHWCVAAIFGSKMATNLAFVMFLFSFSFLMNISITLNNSIKYSNTIPSTHVVPVNLLHISLFIFLFSDTGTFLHFEFKGNSFSFPVLIMVFASVKN